MTGSAWPTATTIDTPRLVLEPLRAEHADEMALVLDDDRLHEFIGGAPATTAQLRTRYERQSVGHSPDDSQGWLNWIVRRRDTGEPVGTVQATLQATSQEMPLTEPHRTIAEVAWVIATASQGQGFATEASAAMITWLRAHGADVVVAHIHPEHHASLGVARRLGLRPTEIVVDGEVRWTTEDHP